ncbi:MAG: acetylornithine/succinylornithine family transaminase [Ignavibacteria bacterium]|nr:acetylornithine/succinylornithine family transaminase [Ignavibacteria bacterium]
MTLKQREEKYFLQTYKRLDIEIERGEGVYLYTKNGDRYLDMFAGLAVNVLGYNHPAVTDAIVNQLSKYSHLSNYFLQEPQIEFAEKIIEMSGFDRVFLTSTGTESAEAAIKITRKYSNPQNRKEIIAFKGGFHGRTYASMSLTHKEKYRAGYEPLMPDVRFLDYNDTEALKKNVSGKTAAVILEYIQGEGGVQAASEDFISCIEELKSKYGFLLIADCIQCGAGRTGKFLSIHHYKTDPDICITAKGIGGGLPLGAVLIKDKLKDVIKYGEHGTTFGGNPVACAAGSAVLGELQNGVMQNAETAGDYLKQELLKLKEEFPSVIKDLRGMGLMLGVQLETGFAKTILQKFIDRKILVNVTNENVLRLIPPLIITNEQINVFISAFKKILTGNK